MKIVGTQIRDLSAARYFAARLADTIVFDVSLCNAQSIPQMKEIMGWVDGVEWALEVGRDTTAVDFIVEETGIGCILTHELWEESTLSQILKDPMRVEKDYSRCMIGATQSLSNLRKDAEIYREVDPDHLDLKLLDMIAGVAISAPVQSRVGFSNFAAADRVLDWLEQL